MERDAKQLTEIESRFLIFSQLGVLKIDFINDYFRDLKNTLQLETTTIPVQSPFGIMVIPALKSPKTEMHFFQDHIEVVMKKTEELDPDFCSTLIGQFYEMIEKNLHSTVTRLAINGLLKIVDEQTMDRIRQTTFQENAPLMLKKQNGWGFRTIDTEKDSELSAEINQCITIDKILPEDTPDKKSALMVIYDYNTKPTPGTVFSLEQAMSFINKSVAFKKYVLDEVRNK